MEREFTSPQSQPYVEEDELDFRQLLDVLLAGKWWIAGITIASIILGFFYLWRAQPVYSTNALVQVESQSSGDLSGLGNQQQSGPVVSVFGNNDYSSDVAILQSRSVVGATVKKLNLQIHAKPDYFPVLGAAIARHRAPAGGGLAPALFGLNQYAWGGEHIQVTRLNLPDNLMGRRLTLVAEAHNHYRLLGPNGQQLLTGEVGHPAHAPGGDNVSIFVRDLQAHPGTHFTVSKSSWLGAVNALQSRLAVTDKGQNSGVLTLTLQGTRPKRITNELNSIANTYLRQNVQRHTATAQKRLAFLKTQLPKLRQQMNQAEDRLNSYREKHKAVDVTQETESLLNQEVNVEQQLTQLGQKRAELEQGFTALHPKRRALKDQKVQLEHLKAHLENKISQLPKTQQAILRMERDVRVDTNLYTNLLNESQELQVVKAGTVGNVRIIDAAVRPLGAIRPKHSLVLVLSLVLGALAGVAFVLGRWKLRRGVLDPNEIEARLGVPIYAVVPHSGAYVHEEHQAKRKHRARPILSRHHPKDLAIESLRSLRTSLHFAQLDNDNPVICITGPSPSIGKSFVAINLGILLAQAGQRVLVVDGDMRKGHLHEYIGSERVPGLSDVLAGSIELKDALRTMHEENICLLSSGAIPPNPSELLMSQRFPALIKQLRQDFDTVLIDTPPIMAVTDATIIAPQAGATFMVVKAGESPMVEIEQAVKRLRTNGARTTGVVFNDVPQGAGAYGYHYSGYYQYDYG